MFVPPALKRPESPTEDINSELLVSEHPDGVGSKSGLECVSCPSFHGQKPFPGVYVDKGSSVMAPANLI